MCLFTARVFLFVCDFVLVCRVLTRDTNTKPHNTAMPALCVCSLYAISSSCVALSVCSLCGCSCLCSRWFVVFKQDKPSRGHTQSRKPTQRTNVQRSKSNHTNKRFDRLEFQRFDRFTQTDTTNSMITLIDCCATLCKSIKSLEFASVDSLICVV